MLIIDNNVDTLSSIWHTYVHIKIESHLLFPVSRNIKFLFLGGYYRWDTILFEIHSVTILLRRLPVSSKDLNIEIVLHCPLTTI